MTKKQKTEPFTNTHYQDSSSKLIFEDNLLCSQFLRDYVDLEPFKHM